MAPAKVIELGSGTGASLRDLRPGSRPIAIEPNVHMHAALRRHAARRGIELEIRQESAERTGLPDVSVDAAICTLVLCTVPDLRIDHFRLGGLFVPIWPQIAGTATA